MDNIRKQIDFVDEKILQLFEIRLSLVYNIFKVKSSMGKPILDCKIEKEIFRKVCEISSRKYVKYNMCLFKKILDISKNFQYYLKFSKTNFPGNKIKIIKCKDYNSLKKLIEKKFTNSNGNYSTKIEDLRFLKKFYFYIIIKNEESYYFFI